MSDREEPEADETRRRRLRFRSHHRGTLEADLLLGTFADAHLPGFTADQLDRYEALLEANDPDIMAWVFGRQPLPPEHDNDVMRLLRDHKYPGIRE